MSRVCRCMYECQLVSVHAHVCVFVCNCPEASLYRKIVGHGMSVDNREMIKGVGHGQTMLIGLHLTVHLVHPNRCHITTLCVCVHVWVCHCLYLVNLCLGGVRVIVCFL